MTNDDDPNIFAEPDDAASLSVLYRRVLESTRALVGSGHMVSMADIARHAWGRLTEQERADSVSELLVAYVTRVSYEEAEKVYARAAADPSLHSYLRGSDVPLLWESHADPTGGPDQAVVDRGALLRLLCEDELLRHRLEMAGGSPAAEQD